MKARFLLPGSRRWLAGQYEDFVNNPRELTDERLLEFAERAFAGFYEEHIRLENTLLFPAAQEALSEEKIRELGSLMREHRRITVTMP
jgi:hemerythrin-like domain-containing protein